MITLTAVPGSEGAWNVSEDGRELGTWQRTEHGATFSDTAGARLATIEALGGGSPCAAVAGEGREAGRWADVAHKVLAGQCEIREAHALTLEPDGKYAHLARARCSCGWHSAGYVRHELAPRFHAQHLTAAQREAQSVA